MTVGGEEERGREHREELADRRTGGAAQRVDHRREAKTHRIADLLAREQRRGESHLEHEADRPPDDDLPRSEERRVGKEGVSTSSTRGVPDHEKKKHITY